MVAHLDKKQKKKHCYLSISFSVCFCWPLGMQVGFCQLSKPRRLSGGEELLNAELLLYPTTSRVRKPSP